MCVCVRRGGGVARAHVGACVRGCVRACAHCAGRACRGPVPGRRAVVRTALPHLAAFHVNGPGVRSHRQAHVVLVRLPAQAVQVPDEGDVERRRQLPSGFVALLLAKQRQPHLLVPPDGFLQLIALAQAACRSDGRQLGAGCAIWGRAGLECDPMQHEGEGGMAGRRASPHHWESSPRHTAASSAPWPMAAGSSRGWR